MKPIHTTGNFCFSAHRPRSISQSAGMPFYIFAPDYRETSGGIRVLHYLCHILNELGEEAYIVDAKGVSKTLRTPQLTFSKLEDHYLAGRNPVTIYPEIIHANPTSTPVVVRWLLNVPGHLGKPIEFEEKDLIFFYEGWCLPKGMEGLPLFVHPVVDEVFNNIDNPDDSHRKFECYYANKYQLGRKQILPEHKNLVSLGQEIKRTPEEIAAILRKAKVLYCYEPSGIIPEAQACGCPVLLVRSGYFPLPPDDTHHRIPGLAIYGEENAYEKALNSLSLVPKHYSRNRADTWQMAIQFIEKVYAAQRDLEENGKPLVNNGQKLWALSKDERASALDQLREFYLDSGLYFKDINSLEFLNPSQEQSHVRRSSVSKSQLNRVHKIFLDKRGFIEADTLFLVAPAYANGSKHSEFHLLIRLGASDTALLADTIDALSQQIDGRWILDVVTEIPSPEGIDEVPNIRWHTVSSLSLAKQRLDDLVAASPCDWIIELPAGARLDPLYLGRLAMDSQANSESRAFFVDDDCCSASGPRHSPRFKPGVNPAALQSADLAGPICVRHDAWLATGGASQRNGSPWFSQLLRIADRFGWEAIKHIPDILISYPNSFPSDTESCMFALIEDLQGKDIDSEIIPASAQSWCIRYPLKQTPSISIVILSIGQLDLLSRCFASIIEKTDYPNFEIIIALTNLHGAPDLDAWLANTEQTYKPRIRIVRTELDGNHATRCNAAAMASSSDFLLFLKEDAVAIQERWLEELVRSAAQSGIGGVSPRLIKAGSALIENAGSVLGLNGLVGYPYQGKAKLGEDLGYLDLIHVARDVSTLPAACMLIRKESYLKADGMDEFDLGDHLAETDLCLKIRKNGERLIYQPLSNLVSSDIQEAGFDSAPSRLAAQLSSETRARTVYSQRWLPEALVDPFWNPALSLADIVPTPELEYRARWQTVPSDLPRILAHPIPNGQGDFRISSPLKALSKTGLVSECIWLQRMTNGVRYHSIAEIARLNPDSMVIQNYIHNTALAALQEWNASECRPFTVYALDDLITEMDAANPFRKDIPANARARLQYALNRCDRLVVSTDYLADAYRGFIPDIRVVPNRLEQAPWLSLRSLRRTGSRPRIGWAGGSTHHGDLLLLKEIIERTRNEADWIFFGMCPEEIRPLLAEYHALVDFSLFSTYLASLNLDIAVAPLALTPFNRGKSNLRLLDYGILGIPVICSDIEPYRNSPACRVNNTVAEWTEAIRARIHDPDAREREGDALRRWVLDGYLLENHLEEWLEAHLPG